MSEFQTFFVGGEFCLDLCNTFDHLHTPPEQEFLTDSNVALRWAQAAGVLPAGKKIAPPADGQSFEKLLQTRALLFELFAPFVRSTYPSKKTLDSFNALWQEKMAKSKVVFSDDQYFIAFTADDALEQIEYEAIRSAMDLLLSITPKKIKQCEGCGWFFHDTSRTHARRWCSMDLCGNRAKARRHYERVKQK